MSNTDERQATQQSRPLILFVDDDAKQREQYRIRLERQGYRVCPADGADAAMEALRQERPAVVVLDIAMPERDGLSALQELLDADPGLPVVIHTAYPSYADNFLAWAADAYVVKSQDMTPLLEAVEKAVHKGQGQHP
jgi:DNA-binding NtrC family response regulator